MKLAQFISKNLLNQTVKLKSQSIYNKQLTIFNNFSTTTTQNPNFEMLKLEHKEKVAIVTLHRPKALNALCTELIQELSTCLQFLNKNPETNVIILTGSEKALAAGGDISQMKPIEIQDLYKKNLFDALEEISQLKKPIIAAVNGYALGGGFELAMICDMIIASETAKFGLPELSLGTIPGIGGTQRLVKSIGKSKAMSIIFTGEFMTSQYLEEAGLISKVVKKEKLLEEALLLANKIAKFSQPVVSMAKECIQYSFNSSLDDGLQFEKRLFHSTFNLQDRKEGMAAFVEKRQSQFTNQ